MNSKFLLTAALISTSVLATAQQKDNLAYAITGKPANAYFWADIKQIDITTGKVVKTLFEADKTKYTTTFINKVDGDAAKINPTAYGTAACALDTRHNRLYFAPMHFSEIQYLDLSKNEANFTVVKKRIVPAQGTSAYLTEDAQITRMVIAPDGYGYALTNDANHLIRFSTDKKNTVEDLGKLSDATADASVSIHEKYGSWGGDMVADAFGKLLIVSAKHNVFSIDVNDKTATHIGAITGLPVNYTTNGVVVNNDGNLVVSSANVFDGLYTVDIKTLAATKIVSDDKTFNASDMANANCLNQKEYDAMKATGTVENSITTKKSAAVFPNPVVGNKFNVIFKNQPAGTYNVVLTDISGKAMQTNSVSITKGEETKTININGRHVRGFYMVKVLNASKKLVSTEKVVLD
ncbi:MAG: T9SS type A sorting domain-containing protein [Bacteroidota bacterium]